MSESDGPFQAYETFYENLFITWAKIKLQKYIFIGNSTKQI